MIPFCILAGVLAVATSLGLPSDTAAAAYSKTTYVYKTVAHHPLKADVYRPHDARRHPVIFWLHGGALIFGDRTHIRAVQVERYVKAGFVVVSIDYRLAPETKLPEILEDVRDAYLWVRKSVV